jgi:putative redox protein
MASEKLITRPLKQSKNLRTATFKDGNEGEGNREKMITSRSEEDRYQTVFSNAQHQAFSDTIISKGGGERGFGPHELLEAALACCMNIWVRMYADKHGILLSSVEAKVSLNRDGHEERVFEYSLGLEGQLSEEERRQLVEAAKTCPVQQTLTKKISFHEMS